MNTEEHDDLWHLLGKAKEPVVLPFFSRNVLRAIREESRSKTGIRAWLGSHWRLVGAGACAAVITGFALSPQPTAPDQTNLLLAEQVSQSSDYQVITHLDELIAFEENSVWLEN